MAEAHFSGAVADLRLLNPQNQQHEEGNTGSEGFTSKSLVYKQIFSSRYRLLFCNILSINIKKS